MTACLRPCPSGENVSGSRLRSSAGDIKGYLGHWKEMQRAHEKRRGKNGMRTHQRTEIHQKSPQLLKLTDSSSEHQKKKKMEGEENRTSSQKVMLFEKLGHRVPNQVYTPLTRCCCTTLCKVQRDWNVGEQRRSQEQFYGSKPLIRERSQRSRVGVVQGYRKATCAGTKVQRRCSSAFHGCILKICVGCCTKGPHKIVSNKDGNEATRGGRRMFATLGWVTIEKTLQC